MVFGIQKVLDLTTPKNATCPSFHPSLYTFLPYFPPFPLWVYSQGHPLKSGFALKVDKLTLSKGRAHTPKVQTDWVRVQGFRSFLGLLGLGLMVI